MMFCQYYGNDRATLHGVKLVFNRSLRFVYVHPIVSTGSYPFLGEIVTFKEILENED